MKTHAVITIQGKNWIKLSAYNEYREKYVLAQSELEKVTKDRDDIKRRLNDVANDARHTENNLHMQVSDWKALCARTEFERDALRALVEKAKRSLEYLGREHAPLCSAEHDGATDPCDCELGQFLLEARKC